MNLKSVSAEVLPTLPNRPWTVADFAPISKLEGFAVIEFHPEVTFVLLEPILRFVAQGDQGVTIGKDGKVISSSEPFGLISEVARFGCKTIFPVPVPLIAGFMSYELLHQIENVPESEIDSYRLPDFSFYCYQKIIALPKDGQSDAICYEIKYSNELDPFWEWDRSPINLDRHIEIDGTKSSIIGPELSDLHSNFSRMEYCAAVAEIIEQIGRGEVYQVNLSQRFELPFSSDNFELYKATSRICRPRYGAFLNSGRYFAGFESTIISASPELFLRSDGCSLLSSPIKGTRPRGENSTADKLLASELVESEKDRAELAMIVDLIRNDMGKVAKVGTVRVAEHARLESHPQVHHLVSDITCALEPNATFGDIVRALFPCGSVTGAPKIAAMKHIAKLEQAKRGVYTGAIGYFNSRGGFEFNVAIRTGVVSDQKFIFQVGGGVVYDSEPDAEYDETLAKAKGLFAAYTECCSDQ